MSIRVAINHHTKYSYDRPIKVFPQVFRLKPAPHTRTPIVSYSLRIQPENHFINWQQDPFGNYNARVVFQDLVKDMIVDVDIVADLVTFNPFDFFLEEYAEKIPFEYDEQLKKELTPYLEIKEQGPLLMSLKEEVTQYLGENTVNFLVNLNRHVTNHINYVIRLEPGIQTCEETLGKALGSCRDSGWVLVQLLRSFGLAARFVSGYLVQLKPDETVVDGPNGPEADFTDLHAWAEVFIPGAGWIGLDATSGLLAGEGHIPLACTPDPVSAAAVSGFTEPTTSTMEYANSVTRVKELPRVTLPYDEHQVEEIKALGFAIDEMLEKSDARLMMGGEPTFVSSTDMESDQWNEAADGEDKRKLGYDLTLRLRNRFSKDALIHIGQGKWYPGEPIPRWQYAIYWRKDGLPIWNNKVPFADPNATGNMNFGNMELFANALASCLGLSKDCVHLAYEDLFYYAWEENNLPLNIDVKGIDLKDSIARKTLAQLLDHDLGKPTGIVIPLEWDYTGSKWKSCKWQIKRDKLFLIPGNSDVGYRLPLDRLPVESVDVATIVLPPDPLEPVEGLPEPDAVRYRIIKRKQNNKFGETHGKVQTIKTALCISLKNENISIFLPPVKTIEPFLDLIASVEHIAEVLGLPVLIEGYQPPYDKRIEKLAIAPDPGVLEINIHPSKNWKEIVDKYSVLFEEAKNVKLGAQKFMLDGRHTGTGGGNHITLGGSKPEDSPLLRRPDLLQSMISFWVNHPCLSYLFSSPFVGMTSQSPRVDEGKPDAIYNLNIAFKELAKHEDPPFWLVDRLFRNILTDITGNTHRSEFCIDKLYSPDSSTGRLGILELRGFDMPPQEDMALVQLLLIRALVASFWKKPYKHKLIKWGSELHDRFMIHHYVRKDMEDVVQYLNDEGIAFKMDWLEPFFEFRFPTLGRLVIDETELILRAGIEPWNVLGEEMSSSGTARFVDSSMERIEVVLKNFNPDRYQLLCNRCIVPMKPTNVPMQYVSGIRYKAWAPPSALHPTKGIDTPLVFDIYDTWNKRSIGGCTYHVMHPGGRSYDTFPINAFEAEGRRVTRFYEENHSPVNPVSVINPTAAPVKGTGKFLNPKTTIADSFEPYQLPVNDEFPMTLDLQLL